MSTGRPRLRQVGLAAAVTGTALVTAVVPATAALAAGTGHGPTHASNRGKGHGVTAKPAHRQSGTTSHGQSGTTTHGQSGATAHGQSGATSHGQSGRSDTGPAGNNGTIKIHQVAGDTSHHNQPHVSCTFYLDFFGFDGGQTATVDFAGQAPTGMGTPLLELSGVTVNPAAGRGTGATWDSELGFTTDPAGGDGLTYLPVTELGAPQPQQGYHVKVSVNADGAPGGAKQKVFWIEPCTGSGTGSGSSTSGSSSGGSTTGHRAHGHANGGPSGVISSGSTSSASTTRTEVLGERFSRGLATTTATDSAAAGTPAASSATALPFTGAEIGGLVAAALASLGAGGALVTAARRRRTADETS